jgi:osmotically-inducible protein OsmY
VGWGETTSIVIAVDGGGAAAAESVGAEDDADLARDLRAAIAADDTLSARARGIDVSVVAGRITLRGRVANPREHDDVLAKARWLGAASIADELRVSGTRTHASQAAPGP